MSTSSIGLSLGDAIPLESNCLLVTDTIEADGRFILCHLAAKNCAGSAGVLWLACGADCCQETAVRSAIRRLDTVASVQNVSVRSIPAMLAEWCFNEDDGETEPKNRQLSKEHILKLIQDWRPTVQERHPLLILDDMSTLAALIGEREAYLLAYWARDLSFELDYRLIIRSLGTDATSFHPPIHYFGAGGDTPKSEVVHWEAGLAELADQIVDVRPLSSGYSRDAQGRFLVTDAKQQQQSLYNYLLLDNDIRVFRKN